MKTVSLKLSAGEIAKNQGLTKSAVIRRALDQYCQEGNGITRGSVLDEISDLAGCFEGPGDLSHNPKYMEGHGA